MDLSQEFEVPLSVDDAWNVLTDLERVAPCMPGAQLDEIEGDEYRGRVRVKVGPITVEYKGVAQFLDADQATHTATLRAQGRETKGQGNAAATVKATLVEVEPSRTKVTVDTNLDISGRVAEFGRGALSDVSSKLLGQFVDNLEKDLSSGTIAPPSGAASAASTSEATPSSDGATSTSTASSGTAPTSGVRQINSKPAEPVKVVGLVGSTLVKRLSPIALIGALFVWFRHKRSKSAN